MKTLFMKEVNKMFDDLEGFSLVSKGIQLERIIAVCYLGYSMEFINIKECNSLIQKARDIYERICD